MIAQCHATALRHDRPGVARPQRRRRLITTQPGQDVTEPGDIAVTACGDVGEEHRQRMGTTPPRRWRRVRGMARNGFELTLRCSIGMW